MTKFATRFILSSCIISCMTAGLTAAPGFITVDIPGAGATFITGINDNGDVTGGFYYAPNAYHGFLRTADGTITIFDLIAPDPNGETQTSPTGINNADVITGNIFGTQGCAGGVQCYQGFVRAADGSGTIFSVLANTFPAGINAIGETAGASDDANYDVTTGFVRDSSGTLTTLGPLTLGISGINDNGDTTGQMVQGAHNQVVGFLRTASGTVTTFVARAGSITAPAGVNNSQQVAGSAEVILCDSRFCDITESVGFLRQPSGVITTFNVPGNHQTFALGINARAQIVGVYRVGVGIQEHGFVRDTNGLITPFDVPGSEQTLPAGINSSGVIAGQFFDTQGLLHGFIRTP
jgi:hypothetical protein